MRIGSLQKFSLIDYPGSICATIFTQGCNFRCPYCHNPELVKPELFQKPVSIDEIMVFLKKRRGKLDGVCITGGEPTLQQDLVECVRGIKQLGFRVKIDTNGSFPTVLKALIKGHLVDYIAMDIKASPYKYSEASGTSIDINSIEESIHLIINAPIMYEFRTTVVKSLISQDDFEDIGHMIKGARRYVLQGFIPTKLVDPAFLMEATYTNKEFQTIAKALDSFVQSVDIR